MRRVVAVVSVMGVLMCAALACAAGAQASSIFFIRQNNIWVAAPDGSGAKPLTSDGTGAQPYTWVSSAKSAQKLAYLRKDSTSSSVPLIYGSINPDGTGNTVNPSNASMQPEAAGQGLTVSISPAGDRIAWPRSTPDCLGHGCGYTLYTAANESIDGSGVEYIYTSSALDVSFGAPTGDTLLFDDLTSDFSGPAMCGQWMVVIRAPGSGSTTSQYCIAGGELTQPALRPDGQLIAAIANGVSGPGQLVTVPVSGTASDSTPSPTAALSPAGFGAQHPDFSPDGSAIAFEGPGNTIDTVPTGGGSPRQILSDATSPAWSPYTLPASGPSPGTGTGPAAGSGPSSTTLKLTIGVPPQHVLKAKGLTERVQCNVACSVGAVGAVATSKHTTFTTKTVVTVLHSPRAVTLTLPLSHRALQAIAQALKHHKRVVAEVAAVAQANGQRKRSTAGFAVRR